MTVHVTQAKIKAALHATCHTGKRRVAPPPRL